MLDLQTCNFRGDPLHWPSEGELSELLSIGALPKQLVELQPWDADDSLQLHTELLLLGLEDGAPDLEGLVQAMSEFIVPFCVELPDRVTTDPEGIVAVRRQAAASFVRSRKGVARWGEPGELLLFMVIEALVGAPKIATKMFHKTNPSETVKAADAIHAQIGSDGRLHIFWGEAKLWANINGALKDACKSIASFQPSARQSAARDTDLKFICRLPDVPDDLTKARLASYFAPFYPFAPGMEVDEHYVCFVSYSCRQLADMATCPPVDLQEFIQKYHSEAETAIEIFKDEVAAAGIEHLHLMLVLLPLEAVVKLRRRFLETIEAIL